MESRNTNKLSHPYFENLTGLRAIGALSVFLFHAFLENSDNWGEFYSSSTMQVITKIFSKGNYGVSLFFVLSGFLITYLLLHEAKVNKQINVFGFFMRRLLRIWPLYFLIVGFGFLIYPHFIGGVHTSNSPVMYSLFLSNFEEIFNGFRDPVNMLTITWSVSIEEQFYISWVLLMVLFPFMRKGKGFLPYFLLLIVVSLVFRWYLRSDYTALYYHTCTVMSDLAIGGILAYSCFRYHIQQRLQQIPRSFNLIVYPLGIALIVGSRFVFQGDLIVIEKVVIGIFFAYIIFDQAFGKHSVLKVDKVPLLFQLGTISYGFYMYHIIVLHYLHTLVFEHYLNESIFYFLLYILLAFAFTYVISYLSYHYFEKPILRLKKSFQA